MFPHIPRITIFPVLLALAVLPGAAQAQVPSTKLTAAMELLAGKLVAHLPDKAVVVRQFKADLQTPGSAGPLIRQQLIEQLKKQGVENRTDGSMSVGGVFYFHPETQSVTIQAKVKKGNNIIGSPDAKVYDVSDMATLMGLNTPLPVKTKQAQKAIAKAVAKPQVVLSPGTGKVAAARVSAVQNGPFAIEVCVRRKDGKYVPLPVEDDKGLAIAAMNPSDVYGVRVINNTEFRAAVTLTIDGLNMFRFSTMPARRGLGQFVIPARGSALIKGWHVSDENTAEFLVVDLPDSEAAKLQAGQGISLNANGKIGTITARFAPAAAPGEPFPSDAPVARSVGTALGQIIAARWRQLTGPVRIGPDRHVISVRYSRETPDDLPPPTLP